MLYHCTEYIIVYNSKNISLDNMNIIINYVHKFIIIFNSRGMGMRIFALPPTLHAQRLCLRNIMRTIKVVGRLDCYRLRLAAAAEEERTA